MSERFKVIEMSARKLFSTLLKKVVVCPYCRTPRQMGDLCCNRHDVQEAFILGNKFLFDDEEQEAAFQKWYNSDTTEDG